MRRSIRCPHGMDRSVVPCEQCGDKWDRLPMGKNVRTRPQVSRKRKSDQGDAASYLRGSKHE